MINNFSHVGFFPSSGNFQELMTQLVESVRKITPYKEYKNLKYVNYVDKSGAEVQIVVDEANNLMSLNPYFKGKSEIEGVLERIVRDDIHHEGGFIVKCNDSGTEFPIYFNNKDVYEYEDKNIKLPQIKKIQLSVFPREIKFFEDILDPEFITTRLSERSFTSSGLFLDENNKNERPEAIISGKVISVEEHKNAFSGLLFLSIVAETLGGEIDIVVDPAILQKFPKVGDTFAGQFWVSGRIIK